MGKYPRSSTRPLTCPFCGHTHTHPLPPFTEKEDALRIPCPSCRRTFLLIRKKTLFGIRLETYIL
ncbi:hypothetical protein [Spirochaeta thermophila]|uniref:hypothetical protein n=1 Tax=Winmispira thermophila TaxID=154 RepID=UPI00030B5EEE|nr:hypothetical protein [Spirochaeta thermophila]